jgi:parvulin-like peptidyl-prolyl isomerase
MNIKLFIIFLFFITTSTLFAVEIDLTNKVVATVNSEPISMFDLRLESYYFEKRLRAKYSGERLEKEISNLRSKVLETLVEQKLIYSEYLKTPFPIPRQYIEDEIDAMCRKFHKTRTDFLASLKKYGGNSINLEKRIKEKLVVQIMVQQFCKRPVYIKPRDVYDYYKENLAKFTNKSKYKLFLIVLDKNKLGNGELIKLKKKILSSDKLTFSSLAKVFSVDSSAERGGDLGWSDRSELRKDFLTAINGKLKGDIATLKIDDLQYFFFIDGFIPESKEKFSSVQESIRKQMEKSLQMQKYNEYLDKLKRTYRIEYY